MHYSDYEEPERSEVIEIYENFTKEIYEALKRQAGGVVRDLELRNKHHEQEISDLKHRLNETLEKLAEYRRKENELERIVRNKRAVEILKDFQIEIYRAKKHLELRIPKCDLCDENRKIAFKSPSGATLTEACACSKQEIVWKPSVQLLFEFSLKNGNKRLWYRPSRETEDYFVADSTSKCANDWPTPDEYGKYSPYEAFFRTREECQNYCNWLNSGEKV